jgi:hypothetical protein
VMKRIMNIIQMKSGLKFLTLAHELSVELSHYQGKFFQEI